VAASQARRWSAPALAEVMVFALDLDAQTLAAATPAFSEAGARLIPVDAAEAGGETVFLDPAHGRGVWEWVGGVT
jgi:hypothetical protein